MNETLSHFGWLALGCFVVILLIGGGDSMKNKLNEQDGKVIEFYQDWQEVSP